MGQGCTLRLWASDHAEIENRTRTNNAEESEQMANLRNNKKKRYQNAGIFSQEEGEGKFLLDIFKSTPL